MVTKANDERSDDERYLSAFMTCWAVHKDKEPDEFLLTTYRKTLSRFSIEQIEYAFGMALETLNWFPKPAELLKFIKEKDGRLEDVALNQALLVMESIKRVGGYESVRFEDPVTSAVIKHGFGGWVKLCDDQRIDTEKWFLKDFQQFYASFKLGGRELHEYLPGRTETINFAKGFEHDSPIVFIGNDNPYGLRLLN